MADQHSEPRGGADESPTVVDVPDRIRYRPDRITFFPVTVFFLGALPFATSSVYVIWTLLIPLLCAVWVWRARVIASPAGLEVCNGLRVHSSSWPEVEGFEVPRRGRIRLLRTGADPLRLTALQRSELPTLLAVSERAGSTAHRAT